MMVTVSWSDVMKEADVLMEHAWRAERLEDAHHYFLCASDKYEEANAEHSARLARCKADQCMRALSFRV